MAVIIGRRYGIVFRDGCGHFSNFNGRMERVTNSVSTTRGTTGMFSHPGVFGQRRLSHRTDELFIDEFGIRRGYLTRFLRGYEVSRPGISFLIRSCGTRTDGMLRRG